jgi:protein-L-isoaspartate(D-aspartate) O-methyltransferase
MSGAARARSADSAESTQARQQLLERLWASGAVRSSAVAAAFAQVPREQFVSGFYERQGRAWRWCTPAALPAGQWLERLYEDEPLVTRLDTHQLPSSSSSQPSAMARMLEALAVQPGQRVLEIGTGTGYHAALLAELVGPGGQVWTVELEEELACQARVRLQEAGSGERVQVVAADGWQGYAPAAPYERLIATASASRLPRRWYDQLAPGGRLVMDLQGSLHQSGFLVLEKLDRPDRGGVQAQGAFWQPPLHFMPLQLPPLAASPAGTPSSWSPGEPMGNGPRVWRLPETHPFPSLLEEPAFAWFLQWRCPGIRLTRRRRLLPSGNPSGEEWLTLVINPLPGVLQFRRTGSATDNWMVAEVTSAGQPSLWDLLEGARQQWNTAGRPAQQAYRIDVTAAGAALSLQTAETTLTILPDLFAEDLS